MSSTRSKLAAKSAANRDRLRAGMDGSAVTVLTEPDPAPGEEQVTAVDDVTPEPAPARETTLTVVPTPADDEDAPEEPAAVTSPDVASEGDRALGDDVVSEGDRGTGQGWRRYATAPAARGTTANSERINIPVTDALNSRLYALDAALVAEGHRWVINRSHLIQSAIDEVARDPQRWVDLLAAARDDAAMTPRVIHGRIDAVHAAAVRHIRYTPQGHRAVGPLVAAAMEHLLDAPEDGATEPSGS